MQNQQHLEQAFFAAVQDLSAPITAKDMDDAIGNLMAVSRDEIVSIHVHPTEMDRIVQWIRSIAAMFQSAPIKIANPFFGTLGPSKVTYAGIDIYEDSNVRLGDVELRYKSRRQSHDDQQLGDEVLQRIESGEEETIPFDEVVKELGLTAPPQAPIQE